MGAPCKDRPETDNRTDQPLPCMALPSIPGLARVVFSAILVAIVSGDVYMHSPRGCNDRNCEKNVNRNNGNRLFDSQNNAKGGYACPRPRVEPIEMESRASVGLYVCSQPFAWMKDSSCQRLGTASAQSAVPFGSRHARSKGRRQARGAISWWIAFGPHEPSA